MTCEETRTHLLDSIRGRLDVTVQADVGAHLEQCEACAEAIRTERTLDEVLARELPRHVAPPSLRRRLALMAGPAARRPERARSGRPPPVARVLAIAASIAIVVGAVVWWQRQPPVVGGEPLFAELVTDHLRVLAREHPVDVEGHGAHEVKPWFEGKLDFAPAVPSPDVPDLRLRGGAIGYVFERKAAVVLYSLRAHAVTLLVFRGGAASGHGVRRRTVRGFHVAAWQSGELSYALVSDVNPGELAELTARFVAESDPNGTP
jgi:anti-sigma factor RsiW